MLTSNEINVIGNILNTTWGKFSTDRGSFPVGSAPPGSLTAKLVPTQGPILDLPHDVIARERFEGGQAPLDVECCLVVNYTDIVTFRTDQDIQASIKVFRDIAEKRCAAKIAELKLEFKGAAGRSLKLKLLKDHDSVQSITSPTPAISLIAKPDVRPALYRGYYRYTGVYNVS